MPAAEMLCLYAYIFSPHANSSGQTSGQKVKKCIHYIYAKYPFFILKKCIHYIYTRNHISSRQQSFQRPSHYSPTPQICRQQAEIDQTTTLPPHVLQTYTTQQSQATTMNTSKRGTYLPSRRHTYIFSPTFPAFLKTADREHTSDSRRKKREKWV